MDIYHINKFIFKLLIIFASLFFFSSCTKKDEKQIISNKEIIIDYKNNISGGNYTKFNTIDNFWKLENTPSYLIKYDFKLYSNFDFGKGSDKIEFIISNPIFINNKIFLIDNRGLLSKYDVQNDTLDWQKLIIDNKNKKNAWPASLILKNEHIFITTGDGNVQSYDLSGNLIWKKNFNINIRTPSYIINNLIIIFLNNGELISLNVENGEQVWSFLKENNRLPSLYGGSFYKNKNNLIAISPKGDIHFVDYFMNDYSDLEKQFFKSFNYKNKENLDYSVSVNIYDDILTIIESDELFTSYDLNNNTIIFSRLQIPNNTFITSFNNVIFYLDEEKNLNALNIKNNKLFWKLNIDNHLKSKNGKIIKIIESNNNIIVFISNGAILYLDKIDGKIINEINLNIKDISHVYLQQENILLITKKAKLYLFK